MKPSALMILICVGLQPGENVDVSLYHYAYVDEHGMRTGLITSGGRIEIFCVAHNDTTTTCNDNNAFELFHASGQKIDTKKCNRTLHISSGWYRQLILLINEQTAFGKYYCSFDGVRTTEYLELIYRLCSDKENECQTECAGDETKYCIVTKKGKQSCGHFTDEVCASDKNSNYEACPSAENSIDTDTVCKGIATNYSNVWYAGVIPNCPADTHVRIGPDRKLRFFQEVVLLQKGDNSAELIMSSAKELNSLNMTVELWSKTSPFKPPAAQGAKKIEFPQKMFDAGSHLYKINWYFWEAPFSGDADEVQATFAYYLVVIEGIVNVSISKSQHGKIFTLTCKIIPQPSENFTTSYKWLFQEKDGQKSDLSLTSDVVNVTKAGKYICEATPMYRTCRPHRKIAKTLISDPVEIGGGASVDIKIALMFFCGLMTGVLE